MDYRQARDAFSLSLKNMELLALRDWLAWWELTEGTGFVQRRALLEEPFTAIARAYSEQAAYAAAEYMFLQRGLDATLAGAAYPEVAEPVGYEQAVKAFRKATRASKADWQKFVVDGSTDGLAEFNDTTFTKLSGALNRLVLHPARETVANNIADGAKFARVPEPGACNWCLMLASRGAVYSHDTAGMTQATRYHDHCRCVAIEVSDDAPLPAVNRELEAAWKQATKGGGSQGDVTRQWKNYLDRRSKILQSQVQFPELPGVKIPQYLGKPVTQARLENGTEVELPLPGLQQMPGHVLYGWTTDTPWGRKRVDPKRRRPGDYGLDDRFGHKHGNQAGKSSFPADWTDQQIVDAVRDVLENGKAQADRAPDEFESDRVGNEWLPSYDYKITVEGTVGGQKIRVKYQVVDGIAVQPYAYPVGRKR